MLECLKGGHEGDCLRTIFKAAGEQIFTERILPIEREPEPIEREAALEPALLEVAAELGLEPEYAMNAS